MISKCNVKSKMNAIINGNLKMELNCANKMEIQVTRNPFAMSVVGAICFKSALKIDPNTFYAILLKCLHSAQCFYNFGECITLIRSFFFILIIHATITYSIFQTIHMAALTLKLGMDLTVQRTKLKPQTV